MYGTPCIWIYKLSQWTCRGILCGLLKQLHSGNVVWNSLVHRNLPITQTSSHLLQAGVCCRGCSLEDVQDWSLVLLSVSFAFTGHRDSNSPFVPLSEIQILLRLFFLPEPVGNRLVWLFSLPACTMFLGILSCLISDLLLRYHVWKLWPSFKKIGNFSFAMFSCSQLKSLSKEK